MSFVDLSAGPFRSRAATTRRYPPDADVPTAASAARRSSIPENCRGERRTASTVCPTGAITVDNQRSRQGTAWQLDYGQCIFCGNCVEACP